MLSAETPLRRRAA